VNLILFCDHLHHIAEERALERFIRQDLKFNTTLCDGDHGNSKSTSQIFMICEQNYTLNDGQHNSVLQLLNNDNLSIIFAQNPDMLPNEVLGVHDVFKWPVDVEKLFDFLCEGMTRHYSLPWNTNCTARKGYRDNPEYTSLLRVLNHRTQSEVNNINVSDENQDGVRKLYNVHKEPEQIKERYKCPVIKNANKVANKAHVLMPLARHNEPFLRCDEDTVKEVSSTNDSLQSISSYHYNSRNSNPSCPVHGDMDSRYLSYVDSYPTTSTSANSDVYINERFSLFGQLHEQEPFIDDITYFDPDINKKFLEINDDLLKKK